MKNIKLLIFTYSDLKYEFYAIPFTYFALTFNPKAHVEICLDDANSFLLSNRQQIKILQNRFPDRFHFRNSKLIQNSENVLPNTVRFLEIPEIDAEYIYICDIDIMILEDIMDIHIRLIEGNRLPFSNVIRRKSEPPKLTGLHFIKFDNYYPLPDYSDLDIKNTNDEVILYQLMQLKGLMVPYDFVQRPILGLHMTSSRDALGRTTGSVKGQYSNQGLPWQSKKEHFYYEKFRDAIHQINFLTLYPYLNLQFKVLMLLAEAISYGLERGLHQYSASAFLDKRLLITRKDYNVNDFKHEFKVLSKANQMREARILLCSAYLLWPKDISIYLIGLNFYKNIGYDKLAYESYKHMIVSHAGQSYFRMLDPNSDLALYVEDLTKQFDFKQV